MPLGWCRLSGEQGKPRIELKGIRPDNFDLTQSGSQTQRSKGFGFVQMQAIDEAKRAVAELHDKEYMGRKLVVSGAKAADRRDEREDRAPQAELEQASEPQAEAQSEPTLSQQPEQ